jgi:glutaredoxin 3
MSDSMNEKATPNVVVYTAAFCGYCSGAKSLLERKGVDFLEIRIDKETGKREEMEQRAQRDSVPQVFIGEQHVGGFDDLVELDMDDELDPLLGLK